LSRAFIGAIVLGALSLVVVALLQFALPARATGGLVTQDLTTVLTPDLLANDLLGGGVAVSNVTYDGDDTAAGRFSGGGGIIGFGSGVILSTGDIVNVVGPNGSSQISTAFGGPGDSDLDDLSGFTTLDAAVLEFDFIPQTDSITFQYVFASEEYNEYVGSQFNDVFAFLVNDENCAVVGAGTASGPAQPVSINTINNGQPGVPATNPNLYINNDPFDPDSTGDTVPNGSLLDTEMDGLTVVLSCQADVNSGETNHLKLAIADASDTIYDAAVFIKSGSFTAFTPTPTPTGGGTPTPTPTGGIGLIQGDNDCDSDPPQVIDVDAVDALVSLQNNAGFDYHQEPGCIELDGTIPAGVEGPQIFGDMDCDGDVDAVDALQILRYLAGFNVNQNDPCTDLGDPL
jgi:hypothetical protein